MLCHGTVWVGWDFEAHPAPTPSSGQGCPPRLHPTWPGVPPRMGHRSCARASPPPELQIVLCVFGAARIKPELLLKELSVWNQVADLGQMQSNSLQKYMCNTIWFKLMSSYTRNSAGKLTEGYISCVLIPSLLFRT